MPDASPSKVSSLDLLGVLGLQLAVGVLCGLIATSLPFETESSSWIAAVATMTGAMTFARLKGRRRPEALTPVYRWSLALRVTMIQTALGIVLLAIALPSSRPLMAAGKWVLLAVPIGIVVVFVFTWPGIPVAWHCRGNLRLFANDRYSSALPIHYDRDAHRQQIQMAMENREASGYTVTKLPPKRAPKHGRPVRFKWQRGPRGIMK